MSCFYVRGRRNSWLHHAYQSCRMWTTAMTTEWWHDWDTIDTDGGGLIMVIDDISKELQKLVLSSATTQMMDERIPYAFFHTWSERIRWDHRSENTKPNWTSQTRLAKLRQRLLRSSEMNGVRIFLKEPKRIEKR